MTIETGDRFEGPRGERVKVVGFDLTGKRCVVVDLEGRRERMDVAELKAWHRLADRKGRS